MLKKDRQANKNAQCEVTGSLTRCKCKVQWEHRGQNASLGDQKDLNTVTVEVKPETSMAISYANKVG